MTLWWMIAIAAGVSLTYRWLPVPLLKWFKLDEDHWIYRYLSYAVYAIMGCIIYSTAFPTQEALITPHAHLLIGIKLALLAAALITGCFYRNLIVLVIGFVALYALLLALVQLHF